MQIEQVDPFVRFTAIQSLQKSHRTMVAYDHRIYFCLKNTGLLTVNGVPYPLKPNTFVLWQAGMPYTYASDDPEHPMELATCNFDCTKDSESLTTPIPPVKRSVFSLDKVVNASSLLKSGELIYLPNASHLRSHMLTLCEEYRNQLKYYRFRINTVLQDLLLLATRSSENKMFAQSQELTDKILSYIQAEYKNNPTNADIGNKFGYHPNYINSLFVKQTGLSIHKYITNYKMNEALNLLMYSDLSLQEIANEINIPDMKYFSRLIKKYFHKPPSYFRYTH